MKTLSGLILAALMVAPMATLNAGGHGGCTDGCCEVQCPNCDHTCKFSVGTEDVAKSCYSSECKPICIPKVVFPWQKKAACCDSCSGCAGGCTDGCTGGCDGCAGNGCGCGEKCCSVNNGACVRYVNVLKKYEYTCEKCKYKWEALRVCGPGNGCGSCGGMTPAPAAGGVPTPAEEDMLPPAPPPVTRRAPVSQIRQTSVLQYFD